MMAVAAAAARSSPGSPSPLTSLVGGLLLLLGCCDISLGMDAPSECGDRVVVDMSELGTTVFNASIADVDASKGLCILGTASPDSIIGSNASDVIFGFGGDDFINGNSGSDIIYGGNGNDDLYGGKGKDVISGGNGNDFLSGGKGKDILMGNNGNDDLEGGASADELFGGKGSDTLSGGKGGDTLKGGQGSDTIKICVDDVILGNSTDVGIICKALLTPPSPPSPPPPSTCDGFCGGQSAASCYCDLACFELGDCCDDVLEFCSFEPMAPPPMIPPPPLVPPGSCEGACGTSIAQPGPCFCDNLCTELDDCCPDAFDLCFIL